MPPAPGAVGGRTTYSDPAGLLSAGLLLAANAATPEPINGALLSALSGEL